MRRSSTPRVPGVWDTSGVWLGTSDTATSKGSSATSDGGEGAIAVWTLYRSRLDWDVYAQRVDSAGRLCWSDTGLAVCSGPTNVVSPVAVSDGEGGAIIAWLDDRGLYAQRVAGGAGVEEAPNAEVRATNTGPDCRTRGAVSGGRPQAASRKPQACWDAAGRKVAMLHHRCE